MANQNNDHVSGQANKPLSKPPHALSRDAVSREMGTNVQDGLTYAEAQYRLEEFGRNELDSGPGVQPTKILIRQILNAMMLVLIWAMIVSFSIGLYIEGGVIAAIIILNIIVGFFQEFNAEKTMDSLRSLSSPIASTIRDGNTKVIPTAEIVSGDVVELKTGDTVPADIRLYEAINFQTDEALLTGESLPVEKDAEAVFTTETGPGDRLNIAFSSSTVTKGRARGIVFATGMKTEVGSIATALRIEGRKARPVKRRPDGTAKLHRYAEAWGLTAANFLGHFLGVNVGTPLQKKLSMLAIILLWIAVVCAVIVLASNSFSNDRDVIMYAVATGLSMIPACLVVVLTITMAADICSDKTGTLTQAKMVAKKAWIPAKGLYSIDSITEPFNPTASKILHNSRSPIRLGPDGERLSGGHTKAPDDLLKDNDHLKDYLNVASLANLAQVYRSDHEWKARGDPTEIAIQVFASRFNWNRERLCREESWKQIAEFPFDSDIKKMSVIFEKTEEGLKRVLTKGAVERVIDCCKLVRWESNGEAVNVTEEIQDLILGNMEILASQGLRVLAFASKDYHNQSSLGPEYDRNEVENDLTFQGLIGLYDPPRRESADAVKRCHQAGISVHMLTGDHPDTAKTIATQVGIIPFNSQDLAKDVANAMVMTASAFDKLSDHDLDRLPVLPLVIARCSPITKVRMIEALRRRKRFVAMTGDGVNDSPSLKRADVGIAMGLTGSDVAKDASDIVLTDDNFASILNAVEEGRRMFDNIQRFVLHLLSENIAQACTLLVGLRFKDGSGRSVFPLAPVEILWVIMITSGMPDMGLGVERADPNIMTRPPVSLKSGVFTLELIVDIIVYGFWMAELCLLSFWLVIFGFGDGDLGVDCNRTYSAECDTVFRARSTTFVSLTWFALFLAWEMVDMRRSFFRMQPESMRYFTQWIYDIWSNQFLFWAVIAGFVTIFPTLYIPVINHNVFKHTGITWEWGIVFVEAILFFAGTELWKWMKRIYFRRLARKKVGQQVLSVNV